MNEFIRSGLHGTIGAEDFCYRLGNVLVKPDGQITVDEQGIDIGYNSGIDPLGVKEKFQKLYNLHPGVTDVAIAYGALMILGEFLASHRKYPILTFQLLGKHGSFKTSLARRVVIHLPGDRQEIHFYNKPNISAFNSVKEQSDIFTIHVDDVLTVRDYMKKQKYADLYETIVRMTDREMYRGVTIVTSERIPDGVAASAYDRVWTVSMPNFEPDDKDRWYSVLSDIEKQDVSIFYVYILQNLMKHYDSFIRDLSGFFDKVTFPGELKRTRFHDHLKFLAFSKFIVEKYYFETVHDMEGFEKKCEILTNQAIELQKMVEERDRCEEPLDYRKIVSEILLGKGAFVPYTEKDRYDNAAETSDKVYFSKNGYFFVRAYPLAAEIEKRYGYRVTPTTLGKELEKCLLRAPNVGDSKNVTGFKSGRHMRLSSEMLKTVYAELHPQNS